MQSLRSSPWDSEILNQLSVSEGCPAVPELHTATCQTAFKLVHFLTNPCLLMVPSYTGSIIYKQESHGAVDYLTRYDLPRPALSVHFTALLVPFLRAHEREVHGDSHHRSY